jgi:hypothetical protein
MAAELLLLLLVELLSLPLGAAQLLVWLLVLPMLLGLLLVLLLLVENGFLGDEFPFCHQGLPPVLLLLLPSCVGSVLSALCSKDLERKVEVFITSACLKNKPGPSPVATQCWYCTRRFAAAGTK